MKLVILSIVLCFGFLHAQEVNQNDPNLQTGLSTSSEGDLADTTGIHQLAQRSYGTAPSANCPACAFAQQLGAHEMNAVELGAVPGTHGTEKVDSTESAAEQK